MPMVYQVLQMADKNLLETNTYDIEMSNYDLAGVVSAIIKKKLRNYSFSRDFIRRVAVVSYEAELNIIIHSYGGTLTFEIYDDSVKILTNDTGPGIKDIAQAMTAGYSTATEVAQGLGFGAGMGLPNMKKNSDEFDIQSEFGVGTQITMTVFEGKE